MGCGSAIHPLVFPISKNCFPGVLDIYTPQIPNSRWTTKQLKKKQVWMWFFLLIMVIFGGFYVKLRVVAGESPAPAFCQAAIGRCIEFLQAIAAQLLALKNQQFLQGGASNFTGGFFQGNFGLTKNPHFYGGSKKILRRFQEKNNCNYGPVDFDPLQ